MIREYTVNLPLRVHLFIRLTLLSSLILIISLISSPHTHNSPHHTLTIIALLTFYLHYISSSVNTLANPAHSFGYLMSLMLTSLSPAFSSFFSLSFLGLHLLTFTISSLIFLCTSQKERSLMGKC